MHKQGRAGAARACLLRFGAAFGRAAVWRGRFKNRPRRPAQAAKAALRNRLEDGPVRLEKCTYNYLVCWRPGGAASEIIKLRETL